MAVTDLTEETVLTSFSDVEVTPHDGYITMTINGVDFNLKTAASVSLISFSIRAGSTSETFQAEEGMTWAEWCASEYNTDGFAVVGDGRVTAGSLFVSGPNGYANASDEIISKYSYSMLGDGAGD